MSGIVIVILLLSTQDTKPASRQDKEDAPLQLASRDWDVEWAPRNLLYRPYLADPRQVHSGAKVQFPIDPHGDDHVKIEAVLGGYHPLALWTDPNYPDNQMEFLVEGAVFTRVDMGEAGDLDAADYRFSFPFLYRDGDVTLKFQVFHITSHLGDNYSDREGRKRASYHVNEFTAGLSYWATPGLRFYGELGAAVYVGTASESGRAQLGAEWIGEPKFGSLAPFVAVDLQARNEIDWHGNANLVTGLMVPRDVKSHGFRMTLEYYKGHDQQTQFKERPEHYVATGVAFDF